MAANPCACSSCAPPARPHPAAGTQYPKDQKEQEFFYAYVCTKEKLILQVRASGGVCARVARVREGAYACELSARLQRAQPAPTHTCTMLRPWWVQEDSKLTLPEGWKDTLREAAHRCGGVVAVGQAPALAQAAAGGTCARACAMAAGHAR